MQPTFEGGGTDSEMKVQESLNETNSIDLEHYRHIVRRFIDLVNKSFMQKQTNQR